MNFSNPGRPLKPALNLVRGRPVVAIFEICLRCNSACGYCDLPLNQGRYELSRDEIRRIFDGLYGDGIRHLFIQGGEPFVRQDAIEILEDLDTIGFAMTVVTNGTRFTPELVRRLSALRLGLAVSLDTLDRSRYRQIRGADQLPLVLQGIELLKEFRGPKHLTCIVSALNRADVLEVVQFARANDLTPVVGAYHWDVYRFGRADSALQYERAAAVETFEAVLQSALVPAGYLRAYARDTLHWLEGKILPRCDAGRYSVSIDASGNVAPCLAHASAGNLRCLPLADILRRMDHDEIRACSDNSSFNLLCARVVGSSLRNPIAGTREMRNRRRSDARLVTQSAKN